MSSDSIKYSVCICNYNMADTLEISLSSVLNQLDDRFEVLVIDDGSTDKSVDIIRMLKLKYNNLRLICLQRDKNRKLGETRNIRSYSIYYLSKKYFKPDLLRMDVEGHECEIISGMLRFIKTRFFRPHICFEPHITSYSKKNNFSLTLKKLFSLGYYTNLLSSNAKSGTIKISNITHKKCIKIIKSDGEQRGIFENLKNEDTVNILTKTGGARTVLLSPRN